MDFDLTRTKASSDGIFGDLKSTDGLNSFVTLEHAFGNNTWVTAAVPPGGYVCERRHSPKFGYDVFMLLGVPGHDFIEIHVGNKNEDSDGCILLGTYMLGDQILESRRAFNAFMDIQEGVDKFTLTIGGAT